MTARSLPNEAALIALEEPGTETLRVPVLKVFDGDGFLTRIELPRRGTSIEIAIRCGFIDAPEMEQPGGPEARDFLASLIEGKKVDLVILTKMDTGGSFDRHGRIVAIPYLAVDSAAHRQSPWGSRPLLSRNIELEMVVNGWAWVLDRYEPDGRYFAALDDARRNRRGIWSFASNLHPWEYKRRLYARRARGKAETGHQKLFALDVEPECCPQDCGGHLQVRSGRYGDFLGCSNFPRCHYTRNLPQTSSRP